MKKMNLLILGSPDALIEEMLLESPHYYARYGGLRIISKNRLLNRNPIFMQRGWEPNRGDFFGILTPHLETFSLSDYFSSPKLPFRVPVTFTYQPSPKTLGKLISQPINHNYDQKKRILLGNELTEEGQDTVGATIFSANHWYPSWWYGWSLSMRQVRQIMKDPHTTVNATTMQVAVGVIAGTNWIIQNPHKNVVFAEDANHKDILESIKLYTGDIKPIPLPTSWSPPPKLP